MEAIIPWSRCGFPVLVEPTKNRIDDSVYALDIDEHDHGPSPAPHFDEAPFDGNIVDYKRLGYFGRDVITNVEFERRNRSVVERIYDQLKGMAITYFLKPGERITDLQS